MDLLKNVFYNDFTFDILNEFVESGEFKILLRVSNYNDKRKKIALYANYISVDYGLKKMTVDPCHFSGYSGAFLQPKSSVDLKLQVCEAENLNQSKDGDRIELKINEGKIASLLLKRERCQWWIVEEKTKGITNKDLKKRIRHFELIEEKFGLKLQKFSVKIIDENTIDLFCEVISVNETVNKEGFNIEVAVYDMDDNIVNLESLCKYDNEFKGFELFHFEEIVVTIPIEEIGKIIIYPTR